MSKETLEAGERVPKDRELDMNTLEMIFGTPTSPKAASPDVHTITNEKAVKETAHNTVNINNNNKTDAEISKPIPLLEPDKGRPKPPLAGPEVDDLDDQPVDNNVEDFHGIDDGLLEPVLPKSDKPVITQNGGGKEEKDADGAHEHEPHDDGVGTDDGKFLWPHDETDYPYDGVHSFDNRFGIDDRPISPIPGSIPDVNTYQQKKNLAQGMMDLALLSANANQLRYVIESSFSGHPYFYPSVILISLSIILQVAVGVGLILNSRYNVKDEKDICKADKINNMTVLGIFLITIVNVFITSFSVAPPNSPLPAGSGVTVQQAG